MTEVKLPSCDLPFCFANFSANHASCMECAVRSECKQMLPPKEPRWCNPP